MSALPDPVNIVVAGSGLAGLSCAVTLGLRANVSRANVIRANVIRANVTVFERLPVIGGEHWEDDLHADLRARALSLGVTMAPGTTALRWEGDRLLAIGESSGLHPADALVVATGHRPRTRAESLVDGARTGGVVPATVAAHLQAQGIRLGHHVAILGAGRWSREVAETAIADGARTCTVIGTPAVPFPAGVEVLPGVRVVRTLGAPRVRSIEVTDGHRTWTRACDSLVLAEGRVPYRNIDGAVVDRPGVVFGQAEEEPAEDDLAEDGEWDPVDAGRRAAESALEQSARPARRHLPTTPRIGHPHEGLVTGRHVPLHVRQD